MKAIDIGGLVGGGFVVFAGFGLLGCSGAEGGAEESLGESVAPLTANRFSAWTSLPAPPAGKQFNGAVEATSSWQRRQFADVFTKTWPDERIHVTSRNLDTNVNWPTWQALPNNVALASSPTATTLPGCRTMVAAIGTDSRVYVSSRANNCSNAVNGAGWSNWVAVTGAGYEAAPAIAAGSFYIMLLARTGSRVAYWYSENQGASFVGGWLLPVLPDGNATASPDLSGELQGQGNDFYAAVRSSSTKSYVLAFHDEDFAWQPWWREAPGAYSAGPTYVYSQRTLFGKGTDNGVWQTTGIGFAPTDWSGPQEIGNNGWSGTNPGAVDRSDSFSTKVDVFQRLNGTSIWWSAYR